MNNTELVELTGVVEDVFPGSLFRVQTEEGLSVLARLSGRIRQHRIRVVLGDRVTVSVDLRRPDRGRIVYRHR